MVRINRIGIKQTAKFFAVFYFLISLVFVIPAFLVTLLIGSSTNNTAGTFSTIFGGIFMLVIPFFYALIGFVMVAISSWIYNQIAKRVGGVEIEMDTFVADKNKSSGKE